MARSDTFGRAFFIEKNFKLYWNYCRMAGNTLDDDNLKIEFSRYERCIF